MFRAYSLLEIKSVDKQARIITGTATTPTPDRVGDIINPLGVEFKNPMPMLWQHRHDQPVGLVKFDKPTKKGINFVATLPKPENIKSENLRKRVEEAIESVELGLVRATSIGFIPKKYAYLEDGKGIEFQETEVMELSLVTIPANAEATIAQIKSIDEQVRKSALELTVRTAPDTSGKSTPKTVVPPRGDNAERPASTVKASSTRKEASKMPKTIAEKISAFQTSRDQKADQLAKMVEGSGDGDQMSTFTKEEQELHDTLIEEIKDLDGHIARLKEIESLAAKSAKPVTSETITTERPQSGVRVTHVKADIPEAGRFFRYAHALLAGKGDLNKSYRWAQQAVKHGGWSNTPEILDLLQVDIPAMIDMTQKAAVGAGTTTDATWASPLIFYQQLVSEFAAYLRPLTIIGRIPGLKRVPFNVQIPRATSGTSAGWVGENAPKPVSTMAFDSITLRWAKAAGIVVLTDELVRFSSPSAEAVVRDDLAATITQFVDRQFVDASVAEVTNVSPASIINGVTGVTPTGTTMAAFRADVATMLDSLFTLNLSPAGGVFIMTPTQALKLGLAQNSFGQPVWPGIGATGGNLLGYDVITSQNIPSSTGSPTEGYPILFILPSEILLADDGQTVIDSSNQASIQLDSAPDSPPGASTAYISMWQMNMTALRAERWINWKKRRTGVAQFIDRAKYAE